MIPSSSPIGTNSCIHFAAMKTKVGREGNAPSPAPEGAGQAAKLCPPTSPRVSAGEHSLPKQTPRGRDRSCLQPANNSKSRRSSRAKPTLSSEQFVPFPIRALTLVFSGEKCAETELQILSSSRAFPFQQQPPIYHVSRCRNRKDG